ncbi:MAG: glycosyltransferase family 2 protein, partial [Candidatus Latescibacteria bacterium]|nr:glycosyltransferase family 2 protein [Candidatus Latescibacterota bacterium]
MKSSYSWCVIVLAYNEDATLERVVRQTIPVLETLATTFSILIVNDGSTDNTGQIADNLVQLDDRIRVIHHGTNRGIGYGLLS